MASELAALRAEIRRDAHEALAVEATYADTVQTEPVALHVRYHTRRAVVGDLENQGYATLVDGIFAVVFSREELAEAGVTLRKGGVVTLTEYDDLQVRLDVKEPYDGPITEKWAVAKVRA